MPYDVDEAGFWEPLVDTKSPWLLAMVRLKIEEIKTLEDPTSQGGLYLGKRVYPVCGHHIQVEIDKKARRIKLLKLIQLPF